MARTEEGSGATSGERGASEPTGLTIREVAARSGVGEGTLRMWETRYSFPDPARLSSGHRRYSELQLEQVLAVVRAREQGLSLPTAIEHARTVAAEARPSVYAALRATFPHLRPQVLGEPALLALSHAIEDECGARAERPLLIGCFQRESAYRRAEPRWRELARTATEAIVLADFPRDRRPRGGPLEIKIGERDPLMREWVVVCEAATLAACLVAWERPVGKGERRQFELVWTVERSIVRVAARVAAELAERAAPQLVDGLADRLADPAPSATPELRVAVDLLTRMVAYATGGGPG